MEYNTSREKLIIPEYGRNIQKMIQHAQTIKDREERTKIAKQIVGVMGMLNPGLRDITDFRNKLWDHLFLISDFELDVDSPFPKPEEQAIHIKPKKFPYPVSSIRNRHYGKNVELAIEKVSAMPDGQPKQMAIRDLANFMKLCYLTWNSDTVNDEQIFRDLKKMSGGKIVVDDTLTLNQSIVLVPPVQKKAKNKNHRHKNSRNRHRHK
ncbi:MAG: DUF4290 domain-containing protein [Bacteroidia bacterium]|nr:DUF4290 domain-containing protein [Bacteroidia bacterium]